MTEWPDDATAFHLLVYDPEVIHELSMGRCPVVIQDMAKAMTAWGLIEVLQQNVAKPDDRAKTRRKKTA